jgi:hypothetical protein
MRSRAVRCNTRIPMYRNRASVNTRSFVLWLLPALCGALAWASLSASDRHNEVSIIYACSASVLGVLAISKNEFTVPAFMMLVIGTLNLLASSSSPGAIKYSNALAPVGAMIAFALLTVGIWRPLRRSKISFPLSSSLIGIRTRAIAVTCLSLFVPLVCLTVPIMLNQAPGVGSSTKLLSWNAYMYALFFTGFSYSLAALIWVWPPSILLAKDLFRYQIPLLFFATVLASAYFENLFRNNWTTFALCQSAVLGAFASACYMRSQAAADPDRREHVLTTEQ